MDPGKLDFARICRACKGESEEMYDVFDVIDRDTDGPRVDEMLMACTAVQITQDDGLPNLICKECLTKLRYSLAFKEQCENVDISLREYVSTLKKGSIGEYTNTDKLLDDLQEMIDCKPHADADHFKFDNEENRSQSKCDFIEVLDNNQLILTCRQCFKVFTTVDGLKCHKRLHTGALYKCKLCDKEYTRLNHLQRHELSHGKRKMHVCKICNKTLTRYEHLKRHLVTHLKDKPFSCVKCNRGFNRSEHLLNHMDKCKGDRIHICDICNKGFNRADSLEVHRHIHDNKMPVLPTLENLDHIEDHYIEIDYDETNNSSFFDDDDDGGLDLDDTDCFEPQVSIMESAGIPETEKEETEDPIEADIKDDIKEAIREEQMEEINEPFENIEGIDYYESNSDSGHSEYTPTKVTPKIKKPRGRPRKHGKRGRPPTRIKKEIKEEYDEFEEEEGVFPCPICNEEFQKMSLLEKHAMQHAGAKVFECKTCSKSFSRSTHLKRHLTSHSEVKPYCCEICTKSFNRRDHLSQHMKLHSRAQEYECDVCKRPFTRADHLEKHKLANHNEGGERVRSEKKYLCHVCMKGFTTEKYRDVHMKWHTGEKKFQCRTCDKTFLSKSHLTEHMKFHNDNSKKFLCSECGQRFIRNDYLVIHMRRHRGEKPFKCKFCGKGFPRTTDLTVHERYHTGEKTHLCVICGRGFGRAYNLTVHMRTHTGEKPYQCTYCDAAFAQGNDLKAHVRRHTGERFQCDLCTETFLMGYLLTQHKRTVHGLNVVSNIRRLQPTTKVGEDDPPPITISLPPPIVPSALLNAQLHAQLAMAHLQEQVVQE